MKHHQIREKRERLQDELGVVQDQLAAALEDDPGAVAGLRERAGRLERGIAKLRADWSREMGARIADGSARVDWVDDGILVGGGEPRDRRPDRERALQTIDRHADTMSASSSDRLDRVVRSETGGFEARYLAAVGSPEYEAAFTEILRSPTDAHLRMQPAELDAVRQVNRLLQEQAAIGLGSQGGGYAVPYALDPTINLDTAGVINPVRRVARVETITVDTWKGVNSDGVTAHWYAESAEASDDSPTLTQPSVSVERASAWVPFSIEYGMDVQAAQSELGRLIADAKVVLESQAFLDGVAASNQPIGVLAATGGLTTTQRIQTAGTGAYAAGDNYLLKEAIPARFVAGASILGAPAFFDAAYRLVGGGSAEPPIMPSRDGAWLGLAAHEWSSMSYGTTTGDQIAIAGDWRAGYIVVDRIGTVVELVPHVFGANQRPTGQRGLFAYWRVGAAPLVPNALRYLEVA